MSCHYLILISPAMDKNILPMIFIYLDTHQEHTVRALIHKHFGFLRRESRSPFRRPHLLPPSEGSLNLAKCIILLIFITLLFLSVNNMSIYTYKSMYLGLEIDKNKLMQRAYW